MSRYQHICLSCLIDKTRDLVKPPNDVVTLARFTDGDAVRTHLAANPTHQLVTVIDTRDLLEIG